MRRSVLTRCFAAFLALWFVTNVAEPTLLHACPTHDAVPAAATGHGAAQGEHSHHAAAGSEQQQPEQHQCTCLGDCSPQAPIAPVALALVVSWPADVAIVRASVSPATPAIPAHTDLRLQFATAPPVIG